MAKEEKGIDLVAIVNGAIKEGIGAIVQAHPRFTSQENFLMAHVDKDKLNNYIAGAAEVIKKYEDNPQELQKIVQEFYKNTANHVASGELLSERGKELILRKSLKEKAGGWFGSRKARETLEGEKYLDKALGSFMEIYELMKSGDYAKRMPEIAEALGNLYEMGFADATVNVLYQNGGLDKNRYYTLKKAITERAKYSVEIAEKELQKHIGGLEKAAEKAAAAILAILGIGVILKTNTITGNAIGISSGITSLPAVLWGLAVLGAGIWMLARSSRKNKKENPEKKNKIKSRRIKKKKR